MRFPLFYRGTEGDYSKRARRTYHFLKKEGVLNIQQGLPSAHLHEPELGHVRGDLPGAAVGLVTVIT